MGFESKMMVNAARRLTSMFPGYFKEAKHNYYTDFGYPTTLNFEMLYQAYSRGGLGQAAIEKTVGKTWQDMPEFWETSEPDETDLESDIRQYLDDIRFWQGVSDTDRRSLVGGYAGLILRLADSKKFNQPVDTVPGGLEGLVEVIPAWAGQLTVSSWEENEESENYGKPTMFAFNEANVSEKHGRQRQFEVHPDRVIIWSADGSVHCKSILEAGYNSLLDIEKISGAGGEGFYKNAKASPVLEVDKDAQLQAMANAMGVDVKDLADQMDEQVKDFNAGFDAMLMLQGMTAKTLDVRLISPQHFFATSLMIFSSSVNCPQKILTGSQTGERASTEDASEWARTNMSRRNLIVKPTLRELIKRLESFNILPERDWHVQWTDLTESSPAEKMERAEKMAKINKDTASTGELVYLPGEIRSVTHDDALGKKAKIRTPYEEDDDAEFEEDE